MENLKIVHIASEIAPFSKTGGLADVVSALSYCLFLKGYNVFNITPLYKTIPKKNLKFIETFDLKLGNKIYPVKIYKGKLRGKVPIFFISHPNFFTQVKNFYKGEKELRFYFFSLVVIEFLKRRNEKIDILHLHDWHTGLIPQILKQNKFKLGKIIYTIHNAAYQGGRNKKQDKNLKRLPKFTSQKEVLYKLNFLKRGILFSDVVTTVSQTYALELLNNPLWKNLSKILMNKKYFLGILNGIDYQIFHPKNDKNLKFKMKSCDISEFKIKNKLYLQKICGFKKDSKVPVLGIVSRLSYQKGFDIMFNLCDIIFKQNVNLVVVGTGTDKYIKFFRRLQRRYPNKVKCFLKFDVKIASQIYAGSDIFLMPSRYEPCGLSQMIALKYGTIPVVHNVGGLSETIKDFSFINQDGFGFKFYNFDGKDFLIALFRALEYYKSQKFWMKLVKNAFSQDFSWEKRVKDYEKLYKKICKS